MPTMYEIYDNHSYEYDELVMNEDYRRNLPKALNSIFDFKEKSVIEFGVGTGRLTNLYIEAVESLRCFDRSQHMIDKAKINLKSFDEKITYDICDNNSINQISHKADFVIEGWSFGHTVFDYQEKAEIKIDELVESCFSLLKPGGQIIMLETLGTDTDKAQAPAEFLDLFYNRLENEHGFNRVVIETDYRFETVEEAARIMGFFFGPETSKSVLLKNSTVIREFTGLWYR